MIPRKFWSSGKPSTVLRFPRVRPIGASFILPGETLSPGKPHLLRRTAERVAKRLRIRIHGWLEPHRRLRRLHRRTVLDPDEFRRHHYIGGSERSQHPGIGAKTLGVEQPITHVFIQAVNFPGFTENVPATVGGLAQPDITYPNLTCSRIQPDQCALHEHHGLRTGNRRAGNHPTRPESPALPSRRLGGIGPSPSEDTTDTWGRT